MNHTSVVYNTVVQNPFCICQEGLCASIHFLFNILGCKKKKKNEKLELWIWKNASAQTLPSRGCKDPWDEKCTLHNLDAVQERLVSGRAQSGR